MGLSYNIDRAVLCYNASGDVEFEEGLRVLQDGLKQYKSTSPVTPAILFDIRASTEKRQPEELKAIAEIVVKSLPNSKVAFLVKDQGLYYGLSRMMAVWMGAQNFLCEVFLDDEKAIEWLKND